MVWMMMRWGFFIAQTTARPTICVSYCRSMSDQTLAAMLQNEAFVPDGQLFGADRSTDWDVAMDLQLSSAYDSESYIIREIARREEIDVQMEVISDAPSVLLAKK